MKWSVVGLIFVGLIAALCAAVLTAALRSGGLLALAKPRDKSAEVEIAVAALDLQAMTLIDSGSVITKKVSAAEAPERHFTDAVQVVGKVLSVPMVEGQAFTPRCFAAEGSGTELAAALEKGMRAVSVSLTDYSGLYGLLYPGSLVDVLATFKERAERGQKLDAVAVTLLRGIQVLAVEDQTVVSAEPEEDSKPGERRRNKRWMVTLMVDSAEAQALQLAMEHGTLSLAMRNPLDVTTPVNKGPTSLNRLIKHPQQELPKNFDRVYKLLARATSKAGSNASKAAGDQKRAGGSEPVKNDPGQAGPAAAEKPDAGEREALAGALEEAEALRALADPGRAPSEWVIDIYRGGIPSQVTFALSTQPEEE